MYNDNLALLAAAAYGEFPEKNKTGNVRDDKAQIDNIHDTLTTKAEMSNEQAGKFTDTYEIIAHQPNTASGYSGTIVKNKSFI
ncbi:hypothetical protein JFL47_05570 [Haemophilus haemoglobinophilus]|nr:hypothetical protein [Canicola haemoglobinophilus]